MALVVQTNVASLRAQNAVTRTNAALAMNFNKLSSGYRINTAADDAAGSAISESLRMQIRSYTVAERNANDGISMAQTAEGALGSMTSLLGRMRELSMQASNGGLSGTDRGYVNAEFKQLQQEMDRIQKSTTYNGTRLLKSTGTAIHFQVGLNATGIDQISVTFGGLGLSTLIGTGTTVKGAGPTAALSAIGQIDKALGTISTQRAKFGAAMNRLAETTNTIQTIRTNLSAANSRIRDVDVAEESSAMARNQVLAQGGAAVLAQANQMPQVALGLLRGG